MLLFQERHIARVLAGKSLTHAEQLIYFQQMKDIRACVQYYVSIVPGSCSLVHQWVELGVVAVLDSFDKHVTSRSQEAGSLSLPAISRWLDDEWHPRQIKETLLDRLALHGGLGCLPGLTRIRLRAWSSRLHAAFIQPREPSIENMKLFYDTVLLPLGSLVASDAAL